MRQQLRRFQDILEVKLDFFFLLMDKYYTYDWATVPKAEQERPKQQ